MVVVVVVVVVIPVGGISGLPRRKAVFFSQSRCSLPHFHVPWPSPLLCSYEKKRYPGTTPTFWKHQTALNGHE